MSEGDYVRAISVYKELLFFSTVPESSASYKYQIGKAYRLSRRYELSITALGELSNTPRLNPLWLTKMNVQLGLNYLGMQVPAQAVIYFREAQKLDTTGLAVLYLGVVESEHERWEAAREYFDNAASSQIPEVRNLAHEFSGRIASGYRYPRRGPLASMIFSAVLPGAGQLYCGHYFDAAQAFSFVAAFSFVSYVAYKYESGRNAKYFLTGISLSITGIFHLANIIGAERTAAFFNQRQKDLLLRPLREKSQNTDF